MVCTIVHFYDSYATYIYRFLVVSPKEVPPLQTGSTTYNFGRAVDPTSVSVHRVVSRLPLGIATRANYVLTTLFLYSGLPGTLRGIKFAMTTSRGVAFLNSYYIGINLENVLYGIELLLYLKTMHVLLSNRGAYSKSNLFYALFNSVMLFCITVWVAGQAVFGGSMWVLESDFPGGPYAYWNANISVWYLGWATIAIIVLQLMTDGLMIYRCRTIWNSSFVVIIPIILWLATFALGILVIWATSAPGTDFHTGIAAQFSLSYWSASVALNVILTSMICYRVLRHGRKIREYLGKEYASLYFAIATIIVESVLPYTLSGIAFLMVFGLGSSPGAFLCVYFMMMCISPQMLILRMAAGKAWSSNTFNHSGSTLKFSPRSEDLSVAPSSSDDSGTRVNLQVLQNSVGDLQEGCSKERICAV